MSNSEKYREGKGVNSNFISSFKIKSVPFAYCDNEVAVNNGVKYSQDCSILYLSRHASEVIWGSEALVTMAKA